MIGLFPQVATAPRRRQGRRMQEDAGPPFPPFLSGQDDDAEWRQGQIEAAARRFQRFHIGDEGVVQFTVQQSVRIETDGMDGRRAAVDGDDKQSVPGGLIKDIAAAFDGPAIYVDIALAVQGDEPPRLQGIVFAPQGCQPFHPAQEAHVFVAPGIGTAVIRVFSPSEAGFVAIVDTRRARHGHLPGHEQLHPAYGD